MTDKGGKRRIRVENEKNPKKKLQPKTSQCDKEKRLEKEKDQLNQVPGLA